MKYSIGILITMFWIVPALAQSELPVGSCSVGTQEEIMDVGNFVFPISNSGAVVDYYATMRPEVPRGSGNTPVLQAGLLMSGVVGGDIRAVQTSSFAGGQNRAYDLWPGPSAAIVDSTSGCESYDRLFRFSKDDLLSRELGVSIPSDMIDWPVDIGAPFVEKDGQSGYSPENGDEPLVLGDEMFWWMNNDQGNDKRITGSLPMGLEIQTFAYAFDSQGALGNTVFYRYDIKNTSDKTIEDFFWGWLFYQAILVDADINHGTDTTSGLVYSYVHPGGRREFEGIPQSLGFTVIDSNLRPDEDYVRYSPLPEMGLTHSIVNWRFLQHRYYYAKDIHDWLHARWPWRANNGRNHKLTDNRYGGVQGTRGDSTDYMFPGDPTTSSFWSMMNMDGQGEIAVAQTNDVIGSYGPVTLLPGQTLSLTAALLWAQGDNIFDAVDQVRADAKFLHGIRDFIVAPSNEPSSEEPLSPGLQIGIFPNPVTDQLTLQIQTPESIGIKIEIFDSLGRETPIEVTQNLAGGNNELRINVSELESGVYHLRVLVGHAYFFDSFAKL
jgi:hypothetical protein